MKTQNEIKGIIVVINFIILITGLITLLESIYFFFNGVSLGSDFWKEMYDPLRSFSYGIIVTSIEIFFIKYLFRSEKEIKKKNFNIIIGFLLIFIIPLVIMVSSIFVQGRRGSLIDLVVYFLIYLPASTLIYFIFLEVEEHKVPRKWRTKYQPQKAKKKRETVEETSPLIIIALLIIGIILIPAPIILINVILYLFIQGIFSTILGVFISIIVFMIPTCGEIYIIIFLVGRTKNNVLKIIGGLIFIFITPLIIMISIILNEDRKGNINDITLYIFTILLISVIYVGVIKLIDYYLQKKPLVKGKKTAQVIKPINSYEFALKNAKNKVNSGKEEYLKKSHDQAITYWKTAIELYTQAMELCISKEEKNQLETNIIILKKDIVNAHLAQLDVHEKNANKAHKTSDLQKSRTEWYNAQSHLQRAVDLIKKSRIDVPTDKLDLKKNQLNSTLDKLEIEQLCEEIDKQMEKARSKQDVSLLDALKIASEACLSYSQIKTKTAKNPDFHSLLSRIESSLLYARNYQSKLQVKMDELIGITPTTTGIQLDSLEIHKGATLEGETSKNKAQNQISILREYEFIGGQVRFKVALSNNTKTPFTNISITFDIPDALKWITHEPNYERTGASVRIPKLGAKEKKAVSLYLEPIICMESPMNATISYFDGLDHHQALTMSPKVISISCPLFFTDVDANLARVKQIFNKLNHRDTKLFPLLNTETLSSMMSTALLVLGEFDIKLIHNELSDDHQLGEAWFYGLTKIKKNRIITHIVLDGVQKWVKFEVSGENEEQITAFLAELGDRLRKELIRQQIITEHDPFFDLRIAIISHACPYCGEEIPDETVQTYLNGTYIECCYCKTIIASQN